MNARDALLVQKATGRSMNISHLSHLPDAARDANRWAGRVGAVGYAADIYFGVEAYQRGDSLTAGHHLISISYGVGLTVTGAVSSFGAPVLVVGTGSYMVGTWISEKTTLPADMLCWGFGPC